MTTTCPNPHHRYIASHGILCPTCDGTDTAPESISMDAIVAALTARGLTAYVEQTGGGCATIYAAASAAAMAHANSAAGYNAGTIVLAGPGTFAGPGWTDGRGDLGEFSYGPDDGGDTAPTYPRTTDPDAIADGMAALLGVCPHGQWANQDMCDTCAGDDA